MRSTEYRIRLKVQPTLQLRRQIGDAGAAFGGCPAKMWIPGCRRPTEPAEVAGCGWAAHSRARGGTNIVGALGEGLDLVLHLSALDCC